MPLTNEQQEKVKRHLSSYFTSYGCKCPVCENRNWTIENELAVYQTFDTQYKMIIEGQVIPVALISCNTCHYTLPFNAMKLGLL
jgi:predicted nucleic-acid-binding Zn-ribbon protein